MSFSCQWGYYFFASAFLTYWILIPLIQYYLILNTFSLVWAIGLPRRLLKGLRYYKEKFLGSRPKVLAKNFDTKFGLDLYEMITKQCGQKSFFFKKKFTRWNVLNGIWSNKERVNHIFFLSPKSLGISKVCGNFCGMRISCCTAYHPSQKGKGTKSICLLSRGKKI